MGCIIKIESKFGKNMSENLKKHIKMGEEAEKILRKNSMNRLRDMRSKLEGIKKLMKDRGYNC